MHNRFSPCSSVIPVVKEVPKFQFGKLKHQSNQRGSPCNPVSPVVKAFTNRNPIA